MPGKIASAGLVDKGRAEYEWALRRMGLIQKLRSKNERGQPLAGMRLGLCLHITKETAVFAMAAKGMGAIVTVSEVDSVRALEAKMDWFAVSRLSDAASDCDVFITCTGQTGVIRKSIS